MSARRPMMICLLAVLVSACGSAPSRSATTTADVTTATVGDLATTTTIPDTTTTQLDTVPTFVDPTVPFVPTVPTSTSTTSTTTTTIDPRIPAMCFSAALMPSGERTLVVTFLDAAKTLDDVRARAMDLLATLRVLHDNLRTTVQERAGSYVDATLSLTSQLYDATNRQGMGAVLDAFISTNHHFVTEIFVSVKAQCPGLKADILVPPGPDTYANAGQAMDPPSVAPSVPDTTTP